MNLRKGTGYILYVGCYILCPGHRPLPYSHTESNSVCNILVTYVCNMLVITSVCCLNANKFCMLPTCVSGTLFH